MPSQETFEYRYGQAVQIQYMIQVSDWRIDPLFLIVPSHFDFIWPFNLITIFPTLSIVNNPIRSKIQYK